MRNHLRLETIRNLPDNFTLGKFYDMLDVWKNDILLYDQIEFSDSGNYSASGNYLIISFVNEIYELLKKYDFTGTEVFSIRDLEVCYGMKFDRDNQLKEFERLKELMIEKIIPYTEVKFSSEVEGNNSLNTVQGNSDLSLRNKTKMKELRKKRFI